MTAFRQKELKSFKIQVTINTAGYRDDPAGFSDLTVDVVRDWSNILAAVKELEKNWKAAGVLKSDEKDKEEDGKAVLRKYGINNGDIIAKEFIF